MNNIQTYMNSMNSYKINNGNLIDTHNVTSKKNEICKSEDSIEINETNSIIINTKKAYDAFRDTCKEIGETSWSGYATGDMSLEFFTICDYMELKGIKVPNFACEGNEYVNNNDYLGFIEKMEEFVKTDPDLKDDYPDKFFDFTKLFKEKLLQFGCK